MKATMPKPPIIFNECWEHPEADNVRCRIWQESNEIWNPQREDGPAIEWELNAKTTNN